MDLEEAIGQLIMVGISGQELSTGERRVFARCRFGGFVLFERNCATARQLVRLCRALWKNAGAVPPLIAIDHEGGRVHRLPQPFTRFPAPGVIGHSGRPRLAYRVGRAMAVELALAGINLNFAPVLDVGANPRNPIGDRAFAPHPRGVIKFSVPWMRGLRAGGVTPCGKHFPGHGGADKDSHLELPVVDKSRKELEACDLVPFVQACRERIDCLMTAHVVFPALDSERPATVSPRIVGELLRGRLAYRGVVFSDDMEMKAVADRYTTEGAAVAAIGAGLDQLVYGRDLEKAVGAFEALLAAARRSDAFRKRVDSSCRRITALKKHRLRGFTGVAANTIERRLARLGHQRLLAEIQGSL